MWGGGEPGGGEGGGRLSSSSDSSVPGCFFIIFTWKKVHSLSAANVINYIIRLLHIALPDNRMKSNNIIRKTIPKQYTGCGVFDAEK